MWVVTDVDIYRVQFSGLYRDPPRGLYGSIIL